jgi:hypothetical protein
VAPSHGTKFHQTSIKIVPAAQEVSMIPRWASEDRLLKSRLATMAKPTNGPAFDPSAMAMLLSSVKLRHRTTVADVVTSEIITATAPTLGTFTVKNWNSLPVKLRPVHEFVGVVFVSI